MENTYALIGIGNIMFYDEGIGVYALEFIRENFIIPSNLNLVDGGLLGFTLMTYLSTYKKLFVISTTSEGKDCGELFVFDKEELGSQGKIRQTANEVELSQMVEICSILDEKMADLCVIGIKPYDIVEVKSDLSECMRKNFNRLIELVLENLKSEGIELKRKKSEVSLQEIIDKVANPKQSHR